MFGIDKALKALIDKWRGVYNVKVYGAKGDGLTDDSAAIQAAVVAAEVAGGIVYFPAGTYTQLPAVPFEAADEARKGLEEGIEKVTTPEDQRAR